MTGRRADRSIEKLVDDVVEAPIAIAHGHITASAGTGLGIAVDEDNIARYRRA